MYLQPELEKSPEFQRGRIGEDIVSAYLRGQGYYVLPTFDYKSTGAPIFHGPQFSRIVPDLLAYKDGNSLWAEAKTKKHAIEYRKEKSLRHGIEQRQFDHYLDVGERSGLPVWIYIYEEDTNCLLAEKADKLQMVEQKHGSGAGYREAMVFWPRDSFEVVHKAALSLLNDSADERRSEAL